MTYQVLARKWRPKSFSTLCGQKHVLKALVNSLDNARLHHAYLFTGTRGVGKTTLARIMAKALNCEKGVSATPCLDCQTCLDIDEGRFVDLIEIDAASRTKVEDTREILENVQYRPHVGRYKIYLIDEVHMLSTHSFNALLKTLEEPPAYVVFILATTDPHKIPKTVLSRTLQFSLKHLLPEELFTQLAKVCEQEKVAFEKQALMKIAKAAEGSMRDALSLLDQSIAFSGDLISDVKITEMLGVVGEERITAILDALLKKDGDGLMAVAKSLVDEGADLKRVLDDLVDLLHDISIAQCVTREEDSEAICDYARLFETEELQLLYEIALKGRQDLLISTSYRVGFEMTLLRLLAFKQKTMDGTVVRTDKPQKKPALIAKSEDTTPPELPLKTVEFHAKSPPETSASSNKTVVAREALDETRWSEVVAGLAMGGMGQTVLSHCCFMNKEGKQITLGIEPAYQAMLTQSIQARIETALGDYFGDAIKLRVQTISHDVKTPAKIEQQKADEALVKTKEALRKDPVLQEIVEQFDGKIDEKSIKSVD